jgi:hypothetical protein
VWEAVDIEAGGDNWPEACALKEGPFTVVAEKVPEAGPWPG